LLNHFRNLLLFQVSRGDLNMMEVSEAEASSLKEQAELSATEALTRILEVLADAEIRLRDAASKKILLEVTLLKAIEARNAMSLDSVLKQLQQLREQGSTGISPAPVVRTRSTASQVSPQRAAALEESGTQQNASLPTATEASPQASAAAELAASPAGLEELWSKLVEAAGRASPFVRTYLLEAHPVSFEKSVFTIGFDPEFEDHLSLVDHAKNHTLLQTKLAELGHPNSQIKFVKAEAPEGRVAPILQPAPSTPPAAAKPNPRPVTSAAPPAKEKTASVPFNKDDFKNDPLIQKALEIFKGQIVDVRA
jgi:DNA polymerase-3 subunit gamma/tau